MKNIKYIVFVWLLASVLPFQGFSQSLIRTNPADISDPQALFINPAILPYQNLSFNLGMKVYHVGFLSDNSTGLKHSYSSNSFPNILFNGVGIGLNLQSFNTPLMNNSGIGISLGFLLMEGFSIGASAFGSNLSYDPGHFDLIDTNDPVFQNGTGQWNTSFGAGMLIRPTERLSVGLSCNNINRPDLSLTNDGAKLPFEVDFGIKYYINNIFGASLFSHYEEEELLPGFLLESNIENKGIIKAGYVVRSLMFEGYLNLFKGFGINYRMDYPLNEVREFSYGSHQIGFSWNMRFNPDYTFNIRASRDTVKVIKEYTAIRVNKKENLKQIFSELDDYDLQFPEENSPDEIYKQSSGMSLDDIADPLPHNDRLETYRDNFIEIHEFIKANKKFKIDIQFPDAITAERAMVIKNYLVDSLKFHENDIELYHVTNGNSDSVIHSPKKDSIQTRLENSDDLLTDSEYIEVTSPPIERMVPNKIFFHVTNTKLRRVSQWRILITNIFREPIHEIEGVQNIENLVEWDCFKSDGTLMDVGNYYYQFQYSIGGGDRWIPKKPKRHRLVFVRVNRANTIEVTTGPVNDLKKLKGIKIRLKEPLGNGHKIENTE